MSRITRCPACATQFKVVADQLRVSDGWVRCGHCHEVFDAAAHMLPASEQPAAPAAAPIQPSATESNPIAGRAPEPKPAPAPAPAPASAPATVPTAAQDEAAARIPDMASLLRRPESGADPADDAQANGWTESELTKLLQVKAIWTQRQQAAEREKEDGQHRADAPALATASSSPPAPAPEHVTAPAPPLLALPPAPTVPTVPTVPALPPASAPAPAAPDHAPGPAPAPVAVDFVLSDIHADPPPEDDAHDDVACPSPDAPGLSPEDRTPPAVPQDKRTPRSRRRTHSARGGRRELPSFVVAAQQRAFWASPKVRRWCWLGAAALALLLVWQALLSQRHWLAARTPALTPMLQALCKPVGCSVQPYRQLHSVVIDSSAFIQVDARTYRLSYTLRNLADLAVATPALELTLHDAHEQPVLRRVLHAADLGAPPALAARGEFAGLSQLTVNAPANPASITGYYLVAFYP